jgi:hypothetical protein
MNYLWTLAMPTWMTEHGAALKTWHALTGQVSTRRTRRGEPETTLAQAMGRWVGVNLYPINPEITRAENMLRMKAEIRDMKARGMQVIRYEMQPGATREERRKAFQPYESEVVLRIQQLEEYDLASKIHPNLRTPRTKPAS